MIQAEASGPNEALLWLTKVADFAARLHTSAAGSLISVTAELSKHVETEEQREELLSSARSVESIAVDSVIRGIRQALKPMIESGQIPNPWGKKSHNEEVRDKILSEMEGGQ